MTLCDVELFIINVLSSFYQVVDPSAWPIGTPMGHFPKKITWEAPVH